MASSTSHPSPVSVHTILPTIPLPLNEVRLPLETARLLIRAIVPEDLQALHELRTQPKIMVFNPQGRPDRDLHETQTRLQAFLSPKDETTFNFAICLKDDPSHRMIGQGGCYAMASRPFGWPALGYMLHPEVWGRGLATEFVRAWLDMWRELPRSPVEVAVDPCTVDSAEGGLAREQIVTWTTEENAASGRVLEKSGFEKLVGWREADLRNPEVDVGLVAYRVFV